MDFSYKIDDCNWIEIKDRHINEKEFEKKQMDIIKSFRFHLANLKETSKKYQESNSYFDNLYSFIREMKIILNEEDTKTYLPHSFIEQEMINYLCGSLKLDDNSPNYCIQTEMINLLNRVIVFLNLEKPLTIFQHNESCMIETFKYLIGIDQDQMMPTIFKFLELIYDGTPESIKFTFEILPLNVLQELNFRICGKYGNYIASLVLKFTKYSVPSDKIKILFDIIKYIMENGQNNSIEPCLSSLKNILKYYQKYEGAEEKQIIKNIFEKDEDFPSLCIKSLEREDDKIQCLVYEFIGLLCYFGFTLNINPEVNYLRLFTEANEALSIYKAMDSIYSNNENIRRRAALVFKYAYYKNFDKHSDYLLLNASQYIKKLMNSIDDDVFLVAFSASEALLHIILRLPVVKLKEQIFQNSLFHFIRRIIDFGDFDVNSLIEFLNHIFLIAEKQSWYADCFSEFFKYDCYEGLNDLLVNAKSENDFNCISHFLTMYKEQYTRMQNPA